MDRFDRIYALHRPLAGRREPISERDLETAMECSRATVIRTIGTMRTFLNAPIEYDRERNGYHYASGGLSESWELPGLWFSAAELQALLALEHVLADRSPGLLAEELNRFRERIEALLHRQDIGTGELYRRLRMLGMGRRAVNQALFRGVTSALSQRRRLKLGYRSRSRDQATERIVSPQRLVHYHDNWYLDAWCHMRGGLRIFALDRMLGTEVTEEPALEMEDEDLDANLARSYGIFQGAPRATAVLRFSPRMARWVADETWHPDQRGQWLLDGRYELEFPYADPTELIRDILRFGADVEVVKPKALREMVVEQLKATLDRYSYGPAIASSSTAEGISF